ncbi:hypothetical protein [Nonomuraea sp. NPDC048826]|uniref:hypothetical protein n=1 Tax=Nonomuraea sp. NPDC048826 TaxID=3364347 RepID=UPI00371B5E8C
MVIVDAVLETYDAVDFTAWPIAEPPGDHLLTLSGRMSPAEVALAMAVVVSYNGLPTYLTPAALDQHLADAGALTAPGGLRFHDTVTGVVVSPGCCFGLEEWRSWWDATRGQEIWLGHDPTPQITHTGDVIHLRQDDEATPVELTRGELSSLLTTAQAHLAGFLDLAGDWAEATLPEVAQPLVSALDEHLGISSAA